MKFKMPGIKNFGEGTPLLQKEGVKKAPKHIDNKDLKEGDYMTYKTEMYDKEGNVRKDKSEEDTSELKKDKTGRLYATDIFNSKDTIYARKPIVPKVIK
tara:strand:+ start:509 stop:805 length:297 start_codon:yes stop_codon:yes gene_type:complete